MKREVHEYDEGRVTLSMPRPGIFASEVIGFMRADEARAFTSYGERILEAHGELRGYHDWWAVMGYTNEARLITTDWSVRRVRRLVEIHIALQSPMMRMAVAVANIAMRGRITIHDSVASVEAARDAAPAVSKGLTVSRPELHAGGHEDD